MTAKEWAVTCDSCPEWREEFFHAEIAALSMRDHTMMHAHKVRLRRRAPSDQVEEVD